MAKSFLSRVKDHWVVWPIFALALALRLYRLRVGETINSSDEMTFIYPALSFLAAFEPFSVDELLFQTAKLLTFQYGFPVPLVSLGGLAVCALLGLTINEFSLLFPFALIGSLSCVAAYFLALKVHSRTAGILAGFLMAVLPWQITTSRVTGINGGVAAFLTLAALGALWGYFETGRSFWASLCLAAYLGVENQFYLIAPAVVLMSYLSVQEPPEPVPKRPLTTRSTVAMAGLAVLLGLLAFNLQPALSGFFRLLLGDGPVINRDLSLARLGGGLIKVQAGLLAVAVIVLAVAVSWRFFFDRYRAVLNGGQALRWFYAFKKVLRWQLLAFPALATVALVAAALYFSVRSGDVTLGYFGHIALKSLLTRPGLYLYLFSVLEEGLGPVVSLFSLAAFVYLLRRNLKEPEPTAALLCAVVAYALPWLVAVPPGLTSVGGYVVHLEAILAILTSIFIVEIGGRCGRGRTLAVAFMSVVVLGFTVGAAFPASFQDTFRRGPVLNSGWKTAGLFIRQNFAPDVQVIIDEDFYFLIAKYYTDRAVYSIARPPKAEKKVFVVKSENRQKYALALRGMANVADVYSDSILRLQLFAPGDEGQKPVALETASGDRIYDERYGNIASVGFGFSPQEQEHWGTRFNFILDSR